MPNLERCKTGFLRLVDNEVEYELKLFDGHQIIDMRLAFDESVFKHLAGLHKVNDVVPNDVSSKEILRNIPQIYNSQLLLTSVKMLDDSGLSAADKVLLLKQKGNEKSVLRSDLRERMSALENLDDYFKNVNNSVSLRIYHWKRDDEINNVSERPNSSIVSADFLFEFQNNNQNDYVCFFAECSEKTNLLYGKSIFQSDNSQAIDQPQNQNPTHLVRREKEYEILSLARSDNTQTKSILVTCTAQRMQQCVQIQNNYITSELQKNLSNNMKKTFKDLISERRKYIKAKDEVALQKAIYSYTELFKKYATNKQRFPDEYLEYIITQLKAQQADETKSSEKHCIQFELDMTILAQMSRELCDAREAFVKDKTKEDEHLDKVVSFVEKANTGYGDFAIAVLQKQKESYDTKEKQKLFSKKEIEELKQTIDKEIAMIDNDRDKGDIDKPRGNGGKKITPLVDKPSKTQSIKQIIQTKVSQFKKFVSNVKERISNYISSILNNPSSSGDSGSGTSYAYAGSGNSNGSCAIYAIGELKENPLLQNMCMSIAQPTYTTLSTQIDIVNECSHFISLMENMAVMLKEDTHKAMQEALKPAPKEVASNEKKNKPQTAKKQTQYDYNDK